MSHRINTLLLVIVAIALVTLIAMQATSARGGPLDPPAAPGSTDGVRQAGTPISSIPFVINSPGFYYVTRNLTMTQNGTGISIQASNVTLDLGGFVLDGNSLGQFGVSVTPTKSSVAVRNGSARNWSASGFELKSRGGLGDALSSSSNGSAGFDVADGFLTNCSSMDNVGAGVLSVRSVIEACTARGNADGFVITDSTLSGAVASGNSNAGIVSYDSSVDACAADANFFGVLVWEESTIRGCTVTDSSADGIRVSGGGSSIIDNTVADNGAAGLYAGIYVLGDRNRIVGNNIATNDSGVSVAGSYNMIDDNSAVGQSIVGVQVTGSKNTVIRNNALNNGNPVVNYDIVAGNNAGPVVAAASATNPLSNTQ